MPRPYPPVSLPAPVALPFAFGSREKGDLARVLRLDRLPSDLCEAICHAIGCYKATVTGSRDTTIANVLEALSELSKSGRTYDKAVKRLADQRSGIDYTTHELLQPLAKAVLENGPGSREILAQAAARRATELRTHQRAVPSAESLRLFCGVLRLIFNRSGSPALHGSLDDSWRQCRKFANEVFSIAGIDHADFDAHPERLTEYLGTDVSFG
ncbi:MAG: hypothetical protein ABSE20_16170 [Acetobacteraceae bacterium]|jgi:hypothetical protein